MKARKETKTSFIKIRCNKCENEQNIFNTASSKINCLVCGELMAESTGGRAKIHAKYLERLM